MTDLGDAWRAIGIAEVVAGARVVAIDGRSSGGKTTVAARIAAAVDGAAVVHTDDIAWHHSVFDWGDLLVGGILGPFRRGEPVRFRPPAWDARGRDGAIEVAADAPLLIVEGVGCARRSLAPHYDRVLWVDTPAEVRAERDAVRVAAGEISPAGLRRWMAEEDPFQEAERTWERSDWIVAGTPLLDHRPSELVVRTRLRRRKR